MFDDLYSRYPKLEECNQDMVTAANILSDCYLSGHKLLVMGNGGSSADAEHLSAELMKGFLESRPLSKAQSSNFDNLDPDIPKNLQNGLPTLSLGVAHALVSAFSNDCDPSYVFAQQIWVIGQKDDAVLAISTSGNSKNIVLGLKTAKAKSMPTIALTGSRESQASKIADCCIQAPAKLVHEVQELHLPIYHALCLELEKRFFKDHLYKEIQN